jgi:ABC-type transport system substrate-binding protein
MWNTKKMAVLLGGLMLAGAFQTVQAKDWTGEDMTAYAKSQGKPVYGGIVVDTGRGYTSSFDPLIHPSENEVTWGIYETFYAPDITKGPRGSNEQRWSTEFISRDTSMGMLAESWEQVDPTHSRWKIRKGIHFWTKDSVVNPNPNLESAYGRELNARDILKIWEVSKNEERTQWYNSEKDWVWKAPDDWTIEVEWKVPDATGWLWKVSALMRITAPEMYENDINTEDFRNALGTGAFIPTEDLPGSVTTFKKNPNYWGVDPLYPENKLPYLDGRKIVQFAESPAKVAAMRAGKLDLSKQVPIIQPDVLSLEQSHPQLNHIALRGWQRSFFVRVDLPPWSDLRVRRAAMLAVNHEEALQEFYQGYAHYPSYPAEKGMAPQYLGMDYLKEHRPDLAKLFEYHPEEARALLTEAGYPDGFETTMIIPADWQEDAELFAGYLEEVGIRVTFNVMDMSVYYSSTMTPTPDDSIYSGMAITDSGAPGGGLTDTMKWHHDPRAPLPWYGDPDAPTAPSETRSQAEKMKALHDALKLAPNREEYQRVWYELYHHVYETLWNLPFVALDQHIYWQPWVKGFMGDMGFGASYYANYFMWIDADEKKRLSGRDANE